MANSKQNILVIDDDRANAALMVELLILCGHDAIAAHDGISGIKLAERIHPDLVLLDLTMPGMDGFEVARALRGNERCSGTILVAYTAHSNPAMETRARDGGFDFYLPKPATIGRVMHVISLAHALRRSASEIAC